MNEARIKEIMNYFDYTDKFTLDDFVQIQVPSVYFPNKGSVIDTLDEVLKRELVDYDPHTKIYRKA